MLHRSCSAAAAFALAIPALVLVAACSSSAGPSGTPGGEADSGSTEDASARVMDSGVATAVDSATPVDSAPLDLPDTRAPIQYDAAIKCGSTFCVPPEHCCQGLTLGSTSACYPQKSKCPADEGELTPDRGASASRGGGRASRQSSP